MPSVDVIVPCYQHGHFLKACVDSVLCQRVKDLRILIVDNASTDGSAEVARRLASKDNRIHLVLRPRNLGPHASFNEGVDWACGDYLMILCSDDLLTPGTLPNMVSIMEQHRDASFAYGNDVHWHGEEPSPGLGCNQSSGIWRLRDGTDFIAERCRSPEAYIAAGMVLVRTSVHKAAGHYRTALPHTDDFEMLLRLATFGRVADTKDVVGVKRMHASNRTHDFLANRTRDLVERTVALESFFGHEGRALVDADHLLRRGKRSIAERAYWCGVKDLTRGRRTAFDLFRLAFRLDPRVAVIPPLGYLGRMDRGLVESVLGTSQSEATSPKT